MTSVRSDKLDIPGYDTANAYTNTDVVLEQRIDRQQNPTSVGRLEAARLCQADATDAAVPCGDTSPPHLLVDNRLLIVSLSNMNVKSATHSSSFMTLNFSNLATSFTRSVSKAFNCGYNRRNRSYVPAQDALVRPP